MCIITKYYTPCTLTGILERIISPRERQFVCTPDHENPALMLPINKSAAKLVNLGDKGCEDLPIYRTRQNDRPTQVRIMKREQVLSGKYLFLVKFLRWGPEYPFPLGIVVKELPRGEDFKSSMEIVYAERGIRRDFKTDAMKYVRETFPPDWSIPEKEYSHRVKVGEAFTIDPPNSLDLDDAITVEKPTSSTFRIGIHIADVSFFVKPSTPLDQEAFLRCTSYYPGEEQENIPMLPRELSEGYCSLLPKEDRLAVSVFVTLDEEGRIAEEPDVKRTIVTSCCRLTYLEAQEIINGSEERTTTVPVKIPENIRQLSSLAQKRRRLRLEDRAFDHWQNDDVKEEYVEAHELVEEMMLLANEEVAKILSAKCTYLAPLRIQLPPKNHRLAEWVEMHSKYASLSLQYAEIFQNRSDNSSSLDLLHSEVPALKMQRWVWSAICQAVLSRDLPKIYQLICNEANHPQLAAMQSRFRRIQSESKFVCGVDQPPENIHHYSLGMRSYTQFTSPIRRYMDIVVHRLLFESSMSQDDIAKVCRRSNYMRDNSRKFEKDCKRIRMAFKLQERCQETRVFIESIEHNSLRLHISKPEDDHLAGKQKQLVLSHLNLVSLRKNDHDLLVHWKFRKYTAPDANSYSSEPIEANNSGHNAVVDIPPDDWRRILDAVRSNDENTLIEVIKQLKAQLNSTSTSDEVDKRHESTESVTFAEPYKHPHFGESDSQFSSEPNEHYYEKKLLLKKYDFFSVQLCPHMVRGMLVPDIQLFKVNPHLNICIEHRKYPRESFAHTARHRASREHYETVDEYIKAWRPVLAMEAATEAVKESDGFVIEQLKTEWKKTADGTRCLVSLTASYCTSCQLEFHPGDLVCARVPYSSSEPSQNDKVRF